MSREIRCYDYVNRPYEEVRDLLGESALEVFRNATRSAASRARSMTSELKIDVGSLEVSAEIDITVQEVVEEDSTPPVTRISLEWEAARSARLFPLMKAVLSVYRITGTETQLDFAGTYEPPMGVLGSAMDAMVGHRVADACVHRFVTDVAGYLREQLPGSGE